MREPFLIIEKMNAMPSRKNIFVITFLFAVLLSLSSNIKAQNSVLINFGSNTCSGSYDASFSLIKNPLTSTPILLCNCDLSNQLVDYFNVFVAYNPKNNKVYIADIRNGIETKIWVLDVGLPGDMQCPSSIPVNPTYSYSYISNNFEFDNNGDLWSFSNYNPSTGQCNLDKFDVNTGEVLNTRVLQFPGGNYPNTIESGDLCILPNGRMFATLGYGPSRLFEITNYSTSTNASANFLSYIPKDCYGIAYINGVLEIAGNDFFQGCYYFDYNISSGRLGAEKAFQVGNSPIDNTSVTPAIGCTKQLLNATQINSNTYDLTYEIHLENMGNMIMNHTDLKDDLGIVFGANNVSNVHTSFVSGANANGFTLNPNYNGTTVTSILNPNQDLPNKIFNNPNYFFKVLLQCRVTNLQSGVVYLNSATCKGDVGSNTNFSLVEVTDSSNNGDYTVVDPNKNGISNEPLENIPTPFTMGALPVKFISITAKLITDKSSKLNWKVATPMINAALFSIEFSQNALNWNSLGTLMISDYNKGDYEFIHSAIPVGNLFYRIKQIDIDGSFIYSKIVFLQNALGENNYLIYPNPSSAVLTIAAGTITEKVQVKLYDALGRLIWNQFFRNPVVKINTTQLPDGSYFLNIIDEKNSLMKKIIIKH